MKTNSLNHPQGGRSNTDRPLASRPDQWQGVSRVLCHAVVLTWLTALPEALRAEPSSPSQVQTLAMTTDTNPPVWFITNQVIVSRLAGSGTKGYADGTGTNALFDGPNAGFVDPAGFIYVADWSNHRIRKVSPSGEVTTLGGTGVAGCADGPATHAFFFNPTGSTGGEVRTVAGDGTAGYVDGPGASARFRYPDGIVVDGGGNIFITDNGNHVIRRISASGLVETIAGTGIPGNVDGDGRTAQFANPAGIGLGGEGLLYVVDSGNQVVRKVVKVVWGSPVVPTHYVSLESPNPTPPYSSWATAATNIQDAIDVAASGDEIVVTNGMYRLGTVEANGLNRVVLKNGKVVRSVNGPAVTVIDGENEVRCAYVGDGSVLSGFTLTKGTADEGGGVWCASTNAMLTNCFLVGNSADIGGGAYRGALYNCTVRDNLARGGAGAEQSMLFNCMLTGNKAEGSPGMGGGASDSTLYNCTLTGNSAVFDGGGVNNSTLYNCIVYISGARTAWI